MSEKSEAAGVVTDAATIAASLLLETAKQTAATLSLTTVVLKSLGETNPSELYRLLGRLEANLDNYNYDVKKHLEDDRAIHTAQAGKLEATEERLSKRVTSLESGRTWVYGVAACISFVCATVAAYIGWRFRGA
jgi:hypothetical protein